MRVTDDTLRRVNLLINSVYMTIADTQIELHHMQNKERKIEISLKTNCHHHAGEIAGRIRYNSKRSGAGFFVIYMTVFTSYQQYLVFEKIYQWYTNRFNASVRLERPSAFIPLPHKSRSARNGRSHPINYY